MYYYVYRTTNLINNKYYIGVHKSKTSHDLKYYGSGTLLKLSLIKHGIDNFINEVLSYHNSLDEAYKREAELVTKQLVESDLCYNIKCGGWGGNDTNDISDDTRAKISLSLKGNQYAKGNKFSGKHSVEGRLAIAESRRNTIWDENTRLKISKNRSGKGTGVNNSMANAENRAKVGASKIGLKILCHDSKPRKFAKPDSDKWNELISDGYTPN